jgi:acetyltransferase-like isoleucine patch superfamily enzyme
MSLFSEIRSSSSVLNVSDKVVVGKNVVLGTRCKEIKIGYGCFIGNDIYIDVDYLEIGDYTTIHHGSIIHGLNTKIGHNCWFGHYTIIDSLGGNTVIGNNVGVGAHSQLWSHMKFGDVLNGCRWNSSSSLIIDDDVWLVGHSIIGPIHAKEKSMLLTGGVAVKDMDKNCIYSGSPAKNISDKIGYQFDDVDIETKKSRFIKLRDDYCLSNNVDPKNFVLVDEFSHESDVTQFDLKNRTYRPIRSEVEYGFIKFMLYDKAKWLPVSD